MNARVARRGEVQTVLGPIAPEALGITLLHEHVLCDVTPPELAAQGLPETPITLENAFAVRYHWCRHYGNHILDSVEVAADELARFREAGGGAVVDLTTAGIKPNPTGLRAAATRAGIHLVAGTGFYIESFARPYLAGRSVNELACEMIGHIRHGFGDSGVRAGIIGEIGVSDPWTEGERRALQAAVLAQAETGAAINVHPGRDPASPMAVARFVRDAGGDLGRLIISHMDRTLFSEVDLVRLLDEGCVAEWDFFGIESSYYPFSNIDLPNDGQRLELVRRLMDRGYGRQIAMSQDICTKTRLVRWGGHGYAHLLENVVPMMERKGFAESAIDDLLVHTPRKLLTLA